MRVLDDVVGLTRLLREGDGEVWRVLRAALRSRGIRVEGTWLAFSAEQGDHSEFAVIVTESDDVVRLSWQPSTEPIFEWTTITAWWRDSPYRNDVATAFELKSNA